MASTPTCWSRLSSFTPWKAKKISSKFDQFNVVQCWYWMVCLSTTYIYIYVDIYILITYIYIYIFIYLLIMFHQIQLHIWPTETLNLPGLFNSGLQLQGGVKQSSTWEITRAPGKCRGLVWLWDPILLYRLDVCICMCIYIYTVVCVYIYIQ
jgi:hypothetical protein